MRQELEPSNIKVQENKFEEAIKDLMARVVDEAKNAKIKAEKACPAIKYDENGVATNLREVFGIRTPHLHVAKNPQEALSSFDKAYETQKYLKMGNKLLIGIGVLAVVGIGVLSKYMEHRNKKK